MTGTIQCTEGCTVHANLKHSGNKSQVLASKVWAGATYQNIPTGRHNPAKQQTGNLASGGKNPPLPSESLTYFLLTCKLMTVGRKGDVMEKERREISYLAFEVELQIFLPCRRSTTYEFRSSFQYLIRCFRTEESMRQLDREFSG